MKLRLLLGCLVACGFAPLAIGATPAASPPAVRYRMVLAPFIEGGRAVVLGLVYPASHPVAASFEDGSWLRGELGLSRAYPLSVVQEDSAAREVLGAIDRIFQTDLEGVPSTRRMAKDFLSKDMTADGVTPYAFVADASDLTRVREFIGIAPPDAQGLLQMDHWHMEFHRPQPQAGSPIERKSAVLRTGWNLGPAAQGPGQELGFEKAGFMSSTTIDGTAATGGTLEVKRWGRNRRLVEKGVSYFPLLMRILEATGASWKTDPIPPETHKARVANYLHSEDGTVDRLDVRETLVRLDHKIADTYAFTALDITRALHFQRILGARFDGPGVADPLINPPTLSPDTIDPSTGQPIDLTVGKAYRMVLPRSTFVRWPELYLEEVPGGAKAPSLRSVSTPESRRGSCAAWKLVLWEAVSRLLR